MKKLVSFCVAAIVAVSAVPAMAQCTSCGGSPAFSQPVMSQPVMSTYVPQATYSAPMMSQPVYSQPVYSTPVVSTPMITPMVSSGCNSGCGGTIVGSPVMSAPVMSTPIVSSGCGTVVSAPMVSTGCGGCGGAVMSQNIIWEGGAPIQGTIVSDVVVEGGEATATEEASNGVDVVEPPAAEEEATEAPEPDTAEEADSTEGET